MTSYSEPPWRAEARAREAEAKRIREMIDRLAEKSRELELLRNEILTAINAIKTSE